MDKANAVADWMQVPAQDELDKLVAKPVNDPGSPYTDYRPNAPAANLDLPGAAILAAMNASADIFGSRRAGQPKHTDEGYKYLIGCLKRGCCADALARYYHPLLLPDVKPRALYVRTLGKSTGAKLSRPKAYQGCAAGALPNGADFAFVAKTQPQIFQYVTFGQTHAFNHEQEQAIINAFYGVKNPADRSECRIKRPLRTEDPTDGTHCLVNKTMGGILVGKGIKSLHSPGNCPSICPSGQKTTGTVALRQYIGRQFLTTQNQFDEPVGALCIRLLTGASKVSSTSKMSSWFS